MFPNLHKFPRFYSLPRTSKRRLFSKYFQTSHKGATQFPDILVKFQIEICFQIFGKNSWFGRFPKTTVIFQNVPILPKCTHGYILSPNFEVMPFHQFSSIRHQIHSIGCFRSCLFNSHVCLRLYSFPIKIGRNWLYRLSWGESVMGNP